MRHLVYAVKILVNEDLKAQERRKVRRPSRRRTPEVAAPQPAVRPTPVPAPAARTAADARA